MNEKEKSKEQFFNKESLEGRSEVQKENIEDRKEHGDFFAGESKEEFIERKIGEDLKKMEEAPEILEEQIKDEKKQIDNLKKEGKLSRLLNIAQEKGAPFAVAVARRMNDPFILDALHDILIEKRLYEKK